MDINEVLVKPVITEKATKLSENSGRYTFEVNRTANKIEIRKAVEAMYGVSVKEVKTLVVAGKARSRFTKTSVSKGQTNTKKKAIVTLHSGETIDFFSNI